MSDSPGPTPPEDRIVALDALRGFALLGILLINIWVFSMPEDVLFNPNIYGDFTGANYYAWLLTHVFAEGKFIALFTMLFGAGIVLFTASKERKGQDARTLYYRRTLWLIVIGLAHAYLLWFGDILVAYGLSALWVVTLRHWEASKQLLAGVGLLAVPSGLELLVALQPGADIAAQWNPPRSAIQAEIETYRSGWFAQLEHRVPAAVQRQTSGFVSYSFWRVSGLMLVGMALFRLEILSGGRSTAFYRRLVVGGALGGLSLILAGVAVITAADWSADAALYWRQFNYWGAPLLACAYLGLVFLYADWRPDGPVTRALAAVGRTAFSNYLFQTVIATSIFYGHGLGLFGRVDRVELLGIVLLVWMIQVLLSVIWLRYFRFGPVEWVWRVLTYRRREPLRN
ncbi:DUF418 domain-containing protein [Natranaeroarchaeum aerophilus]|uniref:DUF418 domain-containing protein n=1 Tax=Natranaeroarchaeum aerophilus TaxID=2917711 RepID=A0AAE3FPT0_9EURY|nr:DUF418 domain-containing protein [Natranaeroarchaeum aerophilus]MCL9812419.1 DUF418 domain-containing protein [Natranaeroarchaeum aerophilus]